jgi:hypothetical protein
MNVQKIIKDHNLSIRKLPMTRLAWKRVWYDDNNRSEIKYFDKPIKHANCWLCQPHSAQHTPTMFWRTKDNYHHPDPTLEGCLTKFILAAYPDDEAKQTEYLCK